MLAERDDVLLDDGGHRPAARAHAAQVDGVAGVGDRDGAHHRALARGEQVQLLAQGVEGDLEVLDDRVGLVLLLEGVLARVADGVLGDVVEVADAGGLARVDQLLAGVADQERLHELLRHRDVEEVALLLLAAQLHQALLLAPLDVGQGAHGDVEGGVLAALHGVQHAPRRASRSWPIGLLRDRVLARRPPTPPRPRSGPWPSASPGGPRAPAPSPLPSSRPRSPCGPPAGTPS